MPHQNPKPARTLAQNHQTHILAQNHPIQVLAPNQTHPPEGQTRLKINSQMTHRSGYQTPQIGTMYHFRTNSPLWTPRHQKF